MKCPVGSVLFAALIYLFCSVATPARGQRKTDLDSILSSFPGYHLLSLNERDANTRAFILRHFPNANTSIVKADFDGDSHLDYAMLLKSDKSDATKVVVLLCGGEVACHSVYELDVTTFSDVVYLRPFAAGSRASQTEAADSANHSSAAKLKTTGIQVIYFEKGKVMLYWNKKLRKIEEVQTED